MNREVRLLEKEMEEIKSSLVEPGVNDYVRYREQVARYHGLKFAVEAIKKANKEED